MKILAIVIPHGGRHTGDCMWLYFPLGLAYVIASIRKHLPEADIRVSDFSLKRVFSKEDVEATLREIKNDFDPDFIIYGGMITRLTFINVLSEESRKIFPRAKLVLGGTAVESGYKIFSTDKAIDYLVVGEGEEAIIDILKGNVPAGGSLTGADKKSILVEHAVKDFDSIPMPSYKDFRVEEYINSNKRFTGWKYLPMVTSRGCPFRCNFCYPFFGNTIRCRKEDSVIEEMGFLKSNYKIDSINFWDDIQFLDKSWTERFCSKLVDKKIGLKWSCSSRASLFSKKDLPLLKLAKKAGCLRISLGIESGNQLILDKMNKKTSVQQIESAIRIIREAGIKASGSMLLGYPGENLGTIEDSVKFARRNLLKTSFYCLIPLPLTEVYNHCIKNNKITDEAQYLRKVSESGGDASQLVINLTDMDDETYKQQASKANKLVSKVTLLSLLNYYGFFRGCGEYLKAFYNSVKLKISGRIFETP